MELKNAERQLKILGLTDENIKELELLAENQNSDLAAPQPDCDNPDCAECVRKTEAANKSIASLEKAEEKACMVSFGSIF